MLECIIKLYIKTSKQKKLKSVQTVASETCTNYVTTSKSRQKAVTVDFCKLMGEWWMAENKVDTSLFDTNYIMAMVVLSKLMRWRNHKTRVLDLHEKTTTTILYTLTG